MKLESDLIRHFRVKVKAAREANRQEWEATRKLMASSQVDRTLSELTSKVQASSLEQALKQKLLQSLIYRSSEQRAAPPDALKELTGLPATKAIRALCVMFAVGRSETFSETKPTHPPAEIEEFLRHTSNPYDLLLKDEAPSLLDLGAGDLRFEQELVDLLLPQLREQGEPLVLHAVDRLHSGSQVGGVYHADQGRKQYLERFSQQELQFRFWGGIDLTTLSNVKHLLPHYTMVTCHAPANPAFALEPRRLSPETIRRCLRDTRGEFRKRTVAGEEILEVLHEGRVLSFPPWKFEVLGPLALLASILPRGSLCLLTAVDREVFWETVAQLLADERFRPRDLVFNPKTLPEVFGSMYSELMELPIGGRVSLSDLAPIRPAIPQGIPTSGSPGRACKLRYVEIRRGAIFEGLPSSFTAQQFAHMKEEDPPWWILLVPDVGES